MNQPEVQDAAYQIVENEIVPFLNSHSSVPSNVRFEIKEDTTLVNKLIGRVSSFDTNARVLYIVAIDKERNDLVEDGDYSDIMIESFHRINSNHLEQYVPGHVLQERKESDFVPEMRTSDLFNFTAGKTYTKVKLDPYLGNA